MRALFCTLAIIVVMALAGLMVPQVASARAVCVRSSERGSCGPYYHYRGITNKTGDNDAPEVSQNVWHPSVDGGWHQTLYATNPGRWHVIANMPRDNWSVVSFPNTGQNIDWQNGHAPRLSSYKKIISSFAENMHKTSRTNAEAAYDIWLNDWDNEVMIQHDFSRLRPRCSSKEITARVSFGGIRVPKRTWNLCQFGSETIWQLAGRSEQSGKVNILAMLRWLESHRYIPVKSGLTAISYGFEICSTGGRPENFSVSKFTIRGIL